MLLAPAVDITEVWWDLLSAEEQDDARLTGYVPVGGDTKVETRQHSMPIHTAHTTKVTALGGEVNTGLVGWRSRLNFGISKQRCSSFAGSACVIPSLHRYQPVVCCVQCGGRVRTLFFDEASDHCLLDVAARDAQVGGQTVG